MYAVMTERGLYYEDTAREAWARAYRAARREAARYVDGRGTAFIAQPHVPYSGVIVTATPHGGGCRRGDWKETLG